MGKINIHMMTSSNGNFSALLAFVCGIHRSPELWCFLWSALWINGWVNDREAGDLRRRRAHYDVIVMHKIAIRVHNSCKVCAVHSLDCFSVAGKDKQLIPWYIWWMNFIIYPIYYLVVTELILTWYSLCFRECSSAVSYVLCLKAVINIKLSVFIDHSPIVVFCTVCSGWQLWNMYGCFVYSRVLVSPMMYMMTSSNGNIFRVTGHLCEEFTGPRWIPRTKDSDAELWCFLWCTPE